MGGKRTQEAKVVSSPQSIGEALGGRMSFDGVPQDVLATLDPNAVEALRRGTYNWSSGAISPEDLRAINVAKLQALDRDPGTSRRG